MEWVVVIEDSSPIVVGPFATEDEAIEYARNNWEFFDRQVAVVQQRPVDFEDSDEGSHPLVLVKALTKRTTSEMATDVAEYPWTTRDIAHLLY